MKCDQGDWAGAIADFDAAEQLEPFDDHSLEQRDYALNMPGCQAN